MNFKHIIQVSYKGILLLFLCLKFMYMQYDFFFFISSCSIYWLERFLQVFSLMNFIWGKNITQGGGGKICFQNLIYTLRNKEKKIYIHIREVKSRYGYQNRERNNMIKYEKMFYLNSGQACLHSLAASTLAGLSSLGSASIEMTEIRMVSTVWIGNQRSLAFS